MTKLFSIFISFLILFQSININIDEFLHLDELVEHAFYHAEEYGDDIFLFVSKHYGELKDDHNKSNGDEHQDHEQLPFNHQCAPNFISVFILNTAPVVAFRIDEINSKAIFLYQETNSFFEKSNVFQPPKVV